ncbi:MAG: DNA-deoxyinosine glycosylase [Alphaproteobacteria bacterium]
MRHKAASFPYIATKKSRALILGSMPGIKSLQAQQYYAHPQNAFWHIMSDVFDMPVSTYAERVKLIEKNDLALWDVLKCCERHGSLDTNIDDDTIEVNDFAAFFTAHPRVTHVFFNGTKAATEFRRRVLPDLPEEIAVRLELSLLPSTSPARANMAKPLKLKAWKRALGLLTGH